MIKTGDKATKRTVAFSVIILLASLGVQSACPVFANPSVSLDPGSPPDLTLIPPVISVYAPRNNTFYNASFIVLTYNVSITTLTSSVGSPKWWTSYAADWKEGLGDLNTVLVDMESSVAFKEYSVNLTDIPDGSHRLVVYVTSFLESGHYANSATSEAMIDFTVDLSPPSISNLSIENKTYNSCDLPLSFFVGEEVSQASYCIDNQAKVTISGNTTLGGLTSGNHNLTVYVLDKAGNAGESETVSFSVETSLPFPWLPVAAVAVAVVAVVAVIGLLYWKKRRRVIV
jgi:hypothetical protein